MLTWSYDLHGYELHDIYGVNILVPADIISNLFNLLRPGGVISCSANLRVSDS